MVVNLAIRASPWWWIGVAAVVALTVHGFFFLPRRLRRRMELLRAD
jgi:ABC-type dipeptide/oligopeptide/nickel transport system permease subunit